MTHVQRADRLRKLTGLDWTAAEKFHRASTPTHTFKLKQEHDGGWTGVVIYRDHEYTLATKENTFEKIAAWVTRQVQSGVTA